MLTVGPRVFTLLMSPFVPFIQGDTIAVAVSGGMDSLALTLLLQEWCEANRVRLVALTVDHRLRRESRQEADTLGSHLKSWGVSHEILTWHHTLLPVTRIQERARTARYDLLTAYCHANAISALFLAHHKDDQKETRLLRLLRGSTLQGLAGMASIRQEKEVFLMRPLLSVPKASLRNYLVKKNLTWVDDPSNNNQQYHRVRIRKVMDHPAFDWIDQSSDLLMSLRHHTDRLVMHLMSEVSFKQTLTFDVSGVLCWDLKPFKKLPALWQKMMLEKAIAQVNPAPHGPRQEKVWRLVCHLSQEKCRPATLGGCLFLCRNGRLWIQPEILPAAEKLTEKTNEPFWVGVLGQGGLQFLKKETTLLNMTNIPHETLLRIPALYGKSQKDESYPLISVPALGYVAQPSYHKIVQRELSRRTAITTKTVYYL